MQVFTTPCHAVLPPLGVGWEPALIETATGRTMARISWHHRRTRIEPAFIDTWEAQVFLLATTHTALPVVVADWPLVLAQAADYGIDFRDPAGHG